MASMESHGLRQSQELTPSMLWCHPANRGGTMLGYHDVWSKGYSMMSVGFKPQLVHESICMQMSTDPRKRQAQIDKNLQVVRDANHCLAPATGKEGSWTWDAIFFFARVHVGRKSE